MNAADAPPAVVLVDAMESAVVAMANADLVQVHLHQHQMMLVALIRTFHDDLQGDILHENAEEEEEHDEDCKTKNQDYDFDEPKVDGDVVVAAAVVYDDVSSTVAVKCHPHCPSHCWETYKVCMFPLEKAKSKD